MKNSLKELSISILKALLLVAFYCLADSRIQIWPASFITMGFFYCILLREKRVLHQSLISFIFLCGLRAVTLRGIFFGVQGLFSNTLKSVLIFMVYMTCTSIMAFIWGPLFVKLSQKLNRPWQRMILFGSILTVADLLLFSFFPESPEIFISGSEYLIAATGIFSSAGMLVIYLLLCTLTGEILFDANYRKTKIATLTGILLITLSAGLVNEKKFLVRKPFKHMHLALIQTNASSYKPSKIDLELFSQKIKTRFSGTKETVDVFFPEYTFLDNPETYEKIKVFQKAFPFPTRLHVGLYSLTEKGIKNIVKTLSPNGEVIYTYEKNLLFPIGEKAVEFPFIPSEWSKPTVPILHSTESSILEIEPEVFIMPMICYEGAVPDHYRKQINLLNNKKHRTGVFVNISKDSFLEGSSILSLMSQFAIAQAANYRKYIVRVSTTGNTEIISPYGKIVAKLPEGVPDVLTADIPLYDE